MLASPKMEAQFQLLSINKAYKYISCPFKMNLKFLFLFLFFARLHRFASSDLRFRICVPCELALKAHLHMALPHEPKVFLVGAKQPLQRFLGGMVVVIQQGTNVWVG